MNRICIVEGCSRPPRGQGRCKPHWSQWRMTGDYTPATTNNGARLRSYPSPQARVLGNVVERTPSGCWLARPSTIDGRTGYASVGLYSPRRRALLHRYAYEAFVGPIPEGLQIDHLCRVRHCINPAHLEPVTRAVNIQRGYAARRAMAASR